MSVYIKKAGAACEFIKRCVNFYFVEGIFHLIPVCIMKLRLSDEKIVWMCSAKRRPEC